MICLILFGGPHPKIWTTAQFNSIDFKDLKTDLFYIKSASFRSDTGGVYAFILPCDTPPGVFNLRQSLAFTAVSQFHSPNSF